MTETGYLKSKREAAKYLGVSLATLERLMKSGLAFVRVSPAGLVRFRPEDLADFVQQRRVQHSLSEPITSGDQAA